MNEQCDKYKAIPFHDRKWSSFIATSLSIFAVGLVLILIGRVILYLIARQKKTKAVVDEDEETFFENEELEQGWYLDLKEGAGNLVSAQTLQGRILVVLSFIFNLAACALYITESHMQWRVVWIPTKINYGE